MKNSTKWFLLRILIPFIWIIISILSIINDPKVIDNILIIMGVVVVTLIWFIATSIINFNDLEN